MTEIISRDEFIKLRDSGKVKFRGAGRSKTSGIATIKTILKEYGIRFKQEYQFSQERKFRFDFALGFYHNNQFITYRIAIEYEGTVITKKSATNKSGHLTLGGYAKDCTKYNLAVFSGWNVFRYSALNLNEFSRDIKRIKKYLETGRY